MLNGLKAAQNLRKQGGGDVEQPVITRPSQVRNPISVIFSLTSISRSKLIMDVVRVGKVMARFHSQIWWEGAVGP